MTWLHFLNDCAEIDKTLNASSRAPARPCGSFEEKQLIVNEDEPPMDTNQHE